MHQLTCAAIGAKTSSIERVCTIDESSIFACVFLRLGEMPHSVGVSPRASTYTPLFQPPYTNIILKFTEQRYALYNSLRQYGAAITNNLKTVLQYNTLTCNTVTAQCKTPHIMHSHSGAHTTQHHIMQVATIAT